MKKIVALFIIGVFVLSLVSSCKKGENDPSITFVSRKSRLAAEWNLKSGTIVTTATNNGITTETTETYDGNSKFTTEPTTGLNDTVEFKEKITFLKDGHFTIKVKADGAYTIYKGIWYFGKQSSELNLKNKESVILVVTTMVSLNNTYDYTGAECQMFTFKLDRLTSHELVIVMDESDKHSATSTTSSEQTTISNSSTVGKKTYRATI